MISFKKLIEDIKINKNIKLKKLKAKRLDSPEEVIHPSNDKVEGGISLGLIFPDSFQSK